VSSRSVVELADCESNGCETGNPQTTAAINKAAQRLIRSPFERV
jgi:hypothetical protein